MKKLNKFFSPLTVSLFFISAVYVSSVVDSKPLDEAEANQNVLIAGSNLSNLKPIKKSRKYIRGIHLSAWMSGSKTHEKNIMSLFDNTELNAAVIDIKECDGKVYISDVEVVNANNPYAKKSTSDFEKYLFRLKERGIYTIARIVVFRDNTIARKKPEFAIKTPQGAIWTDKKGVTWLDPYNEDVWNYTLQIAERAVDMGFDEIQFDYIRFPSDGNTKNCRYSKPHSSTEASEALVGFLKEANKRLKAKNVKISVDLFGLTTTAKNDMGIGQNIVKMAEWVDYVSPMVYPSHYGKWTYGVKNPNEEPYKIVYCALEGGVAKISVEKLRPWLQDFSLKGYKYGKDEVKMQIQACYDNNVGSWLLWNPGSVYTRAALNGQEFEDTYQQESVPPSTRLNFEN